MKRYLNIKTFLLLASVVFIARKDYFFNLDFVRKTDEKVGVIFGNYFSHYLVAIFISIVVYFVIKKIFETISEIIFAISKKTNNPISDIIAVSLKSSKFWFFAVIGLFFGTEVLKLKEYESLPLKILTITTFLQVGLWVNAMFSDILKHWGEKHNQNSSLNAAIKIVSGASKFFIWAVVLLLILDNLGVKVVSLLAGLGVGGIAVALAVQKILGDVFASVSIMIEKPFEMGDFVIVGDVKGTVESIGVKTIRIRSLTGEQVVISNSDILESRVSNYKRMSERRITMSVSVVYHTSRENMEKIVSIICGIIEKQENTRCERGHLKTFGAGSVDYEFVYWVTKPEYNFYMDVQQSINFAIIDAFAENKIELARPVQTVFLQK